MKPITLPNAGEALTSEPPSRTWFGKLFEIVQRINMVAPDPVRIADLPAAEQQLGARRVVTDASAPVFGALVAEGGSETVPVYSDGSFWRVG